MRIRGKCAQKLSKETTLSAEICLKHQDFTVALSAMIVIIVLLWLCSGKCYYSFLLLLLLFLILRSLNNILILDQIYKVTKSNK